MKSHVIKPCQHLGSTSGQHLHKILLSVNHWISAEPDDQAPSQLSDQVLVRAPHHWIAVAMVLIHPLGQREFPHEIQHRQRQQLVGRKSELGISPLNSSEHGLVHDDSGDLQRVEMRGRGRSLESSEEGNVAAAADAVKVTAGEVAKILEPWVAVGIRHLGFDPEESVGGVVVLSREAALGGEAVVDRDGNSGDLGDKVGAVAVSNEVGSGVEDPAAVVKVNEDGETGDDAVVGEEMNVNGRRK